MKNKHTLYVIQRKTGEYYVGVTSKEIGVNYFTSSKRNNYQIRKEWESDKSLWSIVEKREFEKRDDARSAELHFIRGYKYKYKEKCWNDMAFPEFFNQYRKNKRAS